MEPMEIEAEESYLHRFSIARYQNALENKIYQKEKD